MRNLMRSNMFAHDVGDDDARGETGDIAEGGGQERVEEDVGRLAPRGEARDHRHREGGEGHDRGGDSNLAEHGRTPPADRPPDAPSSRKRRALGGITKKAALGARL
jgi:hypothetical protein